MRRRIGVVAVATAALLTISAFTAGSAQAAAPAAVEADNGSVTPGADDTVGDPAQASAQDREAALIRGDREAADMMGVMPSLYLGKWFMPRNEDERRCIMLRESNANYRATNGTYHGAYQMSAALAVGATWMMQKEVKREFGDEGLQIVQALRKLTPNNWNRYWQDRAFWTIWRSGEGKQHWAGGASNC